MPDHSLYIESTYEVVSLIKGHRFSGLLMLSVCVKRPLFGCASKSIPSTLQRSTTARCGCPRLCRKAEMTCLTCLPVLSRGRIDEKGKRWWDWPGPPILTLAIRSGEWRRERRRCSGRILGLSLSTRLGRMKKEQPGTQYYHMRAQPCHRAKHGRSSCERTQRLFLKHLYCCMHACYLLPRVRLLTGVRCAEVASVKSEVP